MTGTQQSHLAFAVSELPIYSRMAVDAYRAAGESQTLWRARVTDNGGYPFFGGATSGFVARLTHDNRLAVVFRGTEPDTIANLLTDICVWPRRLACRMKIHSGVSEALDQVYPHVLAWVEKHRGIPIDFVGHSLGGMLAQQCAFRMMKEEVRLGRLITFGSPPAGNQAFSSALCAVFRHNQCRVVACEDVVPRTWTMYGMGYRHANGLLYIDRENRFWSAPANSSQICDRYLHRLKTFRPSGIAHHSMQRYHKLIQDYAECHALQPS